MITDKKGKFRPLEEDAATLESIAGFNYDTTNIDTTDPNNIIILYKKSGVTVATETVTITGNIINIVKT